MPIVCETCNAFEKSEERHLALGEIKNVVERMWNVCGSYVELDTFQRENRVQLVFLLYKLKPGKSFVDFLSKSIIEYIISENNTFSENL